LLYATGGVAWATYTSAAGATSLTGKFARHTATGGVVGGGVEWKYNPDLSFRLEGLHYIFNKSTGPNSSDVGTGINTIKNVSVIRVGASYYFR
jgi:opacity protein-like surface antigen